MEGEKGWAATDPTVSSISFMERMSMCLVRAFSIRNVPNGQTEGNAK